MRITRSPIQKTRHPAEGELFPVLVNRGKQSHSISSLPWRRMNAKYWGGTCIADVQKGWRDCRYGPVAVKSSESTVVKS